jgi:hypothetical protein
MFLIHVNWQQFMGEVNTMMSRQKLPKAKLARAYLDTLGTLLDITESKPA